MIDNHARRHPIVLLLFSCLLAAPTMLVADGWTQPEGESFIGITYGSSSSNKVFRFDGETKFPTDNGGSTVRDYPLADRGLFFYIEHGLTDDFTLIGSAALKRSIITSPVERRETEGIGDMAIGGRYRVVSTGPHVLSARLNLTLPTGYRRDLTPPLGLGIPNVDIGAEYGYSFWPAPAYASVALSYRLRPAIYALSSLDNPEEEFEPEYADAIVSRAELGYTFNERILLRTSGSFLSTVRQDDNDFDIKHPPATEQYLKVGFGAGAFFDNGLLVTADIGLTPAGLKTSQSTDLAIGVAWKGVRGELFGGGAENEEREGGGGDE